MDGEHKYEIEVKSLEKASKLSEEAKGALESVGMIDEKGKVKIKGVSPKMLKRMKQEYIECPVLGRDIAFVQCFVCPNFQSRVTGRVLCRGDDVPGLPGGALKAN